MPSSAYPPEPHLISAYRGINLQLPYTRSRIRGGREQNASNRANHRGLKHPSGFHQLFPRLHPPLCFSMLIGTDLTEPPKVTGRVLTEPLPFTQEFEDDSMWDLQGPKCRLQRKANSSIQVMTEKRGPHRFPLINGLLFIQPNAAGFLNTTSTRCAAVSQIVRQLSLRAFRDRLSDVA
jgi:hypothetical protein